MRSPHLLLCSLFLIVACGGNADLGPGGSGGNAATPEPGTGGVAGAGGIGGVGGMPDSGPSPVDDVLYLGRFDDSLPGAVRFSWSGSGFAFRFRGTDARAVLRGGRYFTVVVDGEVQPGVLEVSNLGSETYDLASNLPDGEHTIEVYRRTQAPAGPTVVLGIEVDGEPLASIPRPTRQLEIVGDSWSTGSAVDDSVPGCDDRNDNHFVTWGAIAARALDAELSTVSWGGKGVVLDPMGDFYDRVIGNEPGSTGTIQLVDAVFVSLGANDFMEGQLPGTFVTAYAALLEQIRQQHPGALIACIWPELPDADETALARAAIDEAVALRVSAGDDRVTGAALELEELVDVTCNDHPGVETHALMADLMIEFLQAELGW